MKTLVVVDMQNDFITGSLANKEAESIVDKVVEKIKNFEGEIIVIKDTHFDNYLATQEGRNLPIEHCIITTEGWGLNQKVKEALSEKNFNLVIKSQFGSLDLVHEISKDTESIEFIGICTDICVISNAVIAKSAFPEVPIYVDSSCCAGVTEERHKVALEAMKALQIIVK